MGSIVDPGKDARRTARKQELLLKQQRQKQKAELAEAENDAAVKKSLATSPTKGRRSLISPNTGLRETLG